MGTFFRRLLYVLGAVFAFRALKRTVEEIKTDDPKLLNERGRRVQKFVKENF